ncbi:MAG: ABC transporter permease [Vampirovibrionales bacterium]|nr:ABC transporter permease [Vampirovibrionales bacterium]
MSLFITQLGQVCLLGLGTAQSVLSPRLRWPEVMRQSYLLGVASVPVAVIICVIAGSVMAMQAALKFSQNGAEAYIGAGVSLSIVREVAPIFSALAVTARCATAVAAQLGHMAISSQLDALQVMGVHPVRFLVAPRVLGFVFTLPLITILAEALGVSGGMLVAKQVAGITYGQFADSVWLYLTPDDIYKSLLKAVIFGAMIGLIACWSGLNCKGGAAQVGEASTSAAVVGGMSLIAINFLLSWLLYSNSALG